MIRSHSCVFAFAALASLLAACVGGSTGPLPGTKSAGDVQAAGTRADRRRQEQVQPEVGRPPVRHRVGRDRHVELRVARRERRRLRQVRGVRPADRRRLLLGLGARVVRLVQAGRVDERLGRVARHQQRRATSTPSCPLGAASLGGRVEGGEKFHMEYFVSGTRSATRESVHRGDIATRRRPARTRRTSSTPTTSARSRSARSRSIKGSVERQRVGLRRRGRSLVVSRRPRRRAASSAAAAATRRRTSATCRVPIRLTLREISDGDSAETAEAQAPETPEAKNLAGKLLARTDREHKAAEHADAARLEGQLARRRAGASRSSTSTTSSTRAPRGSRRTRARTYAMTRGQCLMLSGQCSAGKVMYRKALEKSAGANMGPEQLDKAADGFASMNCQGGSMAPRDQLLKALFDLQQGAYMQKKTTAACDAAYQTAKRLVPDGEAERRRRHAGEAGGRRAPHDARPACFAKAGDCDSAWSAWKEAWKLDPNLSPQSREPQRRRASPRLRGGRVEVQGQVGHAAHGVRCAWWGPRRDDRAARQSQGCSSWPASRALRPRRARPPPQVAPPAPDPPTPPPCVSAIAEHQRSVIGAPRRRARKDERAGRRGLPRRARRVRPRRVGPEPGTSPASAMATSRAMCMMLAGDCTHGKDLYRAALASNAGATLGPEMLDKSVDAMAGHVLPGTLRSSRVTRCSRR